MTLRLTRLVPGLLRHNGHVSNAADPFSRLMAQHHRPPQPSMDGAQLVQWLSAQEGNMVGDLQHNVRALMVRVSSPMPIPDGHDEVSSLRKQLRHQQQTHRELQTMLKNQALAIDTVQSKWQMAGQEAHAFVAQTCSQSEDFVRADVMAVQRSEDSVSVNTMVNFDHMFTHYKTNVVTRLDRRRKRCVRSSSMPSLKNPACATITCSKP